MAPTSSGRDRAEQLAGLGDLDERTGGAQAEAADALDDDVGRGRPRRPPRPGGAVTSWACGGHAATRPRTRTRGRGPGPRGRSSVMTRRRIGPRRGGLLAHIASSWATSSAASTLPLTSPSTITAGARLQAPRQRAVSSETLPSAVVSLGLDAELLLERGQDVLARR